MSGVCYSQSELSNHLPFRCSNTPRSSPLDIPRPSSPSPQSGQVTLSEAFPIDHSKFRPIDQSRSGPGLYHRKSTGNLFGSHFQPSSYLPRRGNYSVRYDHDNLEESEDANVEDGDGGGDKEDDDEDDDEDEDEDDNEEEWEEHYDEDDDDEDDD